MPQVFLILSAILATIALGHLILAHIALFIFRRHHTTDRVDLPPVTILVPACGLVRELRRNLQSLLMQDYPQFQLIVGFRDKFDPAVKVARSVMADHPTKDHALVIHPRVWGDNYKCGNLGNMMEEAKHDWIVVIDSDMRVKPDYLRKVMGSFDNDKVGAVTCLYNARAGHGWASHLGSLYINDWFLPSVLVQKTLGKIRYCLGATMAFHRETLEEIGGFKDLSNYIADDYILGNRISSKGYEVCLAPCIVENIVDEHSFNDIFFHELRWARTIRSCQPIGYFFSMLSHNPIALTLPFFFAVGRTPMGWAALTSAVVLRVGLHEAVCRVSNKCNARGLVLIPFRDSMNWIIWACGLFGYSMKWKDQNLMLQSNQQVSLIKVECHEDAITQSTIL